MNKRSILKLAVIIVQLKDFNKFWKFWDGTRNPFWRRGTLWQTLSDLMFEGKLEILVRIASRVLSPEKWVRSRDVRLGNLWKRLGMKGIVWSMILRENRRRLVTERNCLETSERDLKVLLSSIRYLKMRSQSSSSKSEQVSATAIVAEQPISVSECTHTKTGYEDCTLN